MTAAAKPDSRLHLISAYGSRAGSARVRLYDWADHLGLDVEPHGFLGRASNSLQDIRADPVATIRAQITAERLPLTVSGAPVILSRAATPFSSGRIEARTLRAATHSAYDVDDAIMLPMPGARNRIFSKPKVFAAAAAAADVVIAGNDFLADEASRFSSAVHIIPSCVEPGDYPSRTAESFDRQPDMVWIGSPSTERYLSSIAAEINTVHQRTGSRLTIISAGNQPVPGMNPSAVRRVQWSADSFADQLMDGDIGIMPLEDTPWERGKCAYKILQYAASSIPMVASPVGANIRALQVLGGDAAKTRDDWVDTLVSLISAPARDRFSRGLAARRAVEKHYSFTAYEDKWRELVIP